MAVLGALLLVPTVLRAQSAAAGAPPAQPPSPRADSVKAPRRPVGSVRPTPPLTPSRAFAASLILPGLGQSRLDRGSSGVLFASVELAAFVMLRRSTADYQEARRFEVDTLPTDFSVSSDGTLTKSGSTVSVYTSDLVRARRLHREDWLATIAFNHLFAAADAFVSAQLWDMPVQLSATPTANGPLVVATIRF